MMMCNACGFHCCADDSFSRCGCDFCWCEACWPVCPACGNYEDDCTCHVNDECKRCHGEGWLYPIDPVRFDGSYITARPCPSCNHGGYQL